SAAPDELQVTGPVPARFLPGKALAQDAIADRPRLREVAAQHGCFPRVGCHSGMRNGMPCEGGGNPRCRAIVAPMSANELRDPSDCRATCVPKAMTGTRSRV